MAGVVDYAGHRYCSVEDTLGVGGAQCRWPMKTVTWGVGAIPPGLTMVRFMETAERVFAAVSAVCDLQFKNVLQQQQANIWMKTFRGSPLGELAHAYLPCGPVTPKSQMLLEFDDTESFVIADNPPTNKLSLFVVMLHEMLHALGIPHLSGGVAVMNPTYNVKMNTLQSLDRAELVSRYGLPKPKPLPQPDPPPTQPPSADVIVGTIILRGGKVFAKSTKTGEEIEL